MWSRVDRSPLAVPLCNLNQFVYKANVSLSNCHTKFICVCPTDATDRITKLMLLGSMNEIRIVKMKSSQSETLHSDNAQMS